MAHVKFSQMQPQTLLGLMNDKNLDNNKECRAFLKRALDYLHSGKQHGQMMSEWIIPRASTGKTDLDDSLAHHVTLKWKQGHLLSD